MLIHRFLSAGYIPALVVGLALAAPVGASAQNSAPGQHVQHPPAPDTTPTTTQITLDGPPHKGPAPVYYIDGQRADSTVITKLSPNDIASISVLKGDGGYVARQLGPNESQRGVLLIITKAGQHTRAVRAFNRRLDRLSRQAATNTSAR